MAPIESRALKSDDDTREASSLRRLSQWVIHALATFSILVFELAAYTGHLRLHAHVVFLKNLSSQLGRTGAKSFSDQPIEYK